MTNQMARRCCILFVLTWFLNGNVQAEPPIETPRIETPPVLLQMLRNDVVLDEMGASDADKELVHDALDRVDGDWWRSRILSPQERIDAVNRLTDQVNAELAVGLSPKSLARMKQLERQALGTRMFLAEDVAAELKLSPAVVKKMKTIFSETDTSVANLQKRATSGETTDVLNAEQAKLAVRERVAIVGLLTNDQKSQLASLTGDTFAFEKATRTMPRAPEFIQDETQWIQGTSTSLVDLRGKVVIVHFYAYQCINCQRNLPHYNAWFKDYADQNLVVIGIQTPETSSERSYANVTSAAKSDGIEYPVLMDPQSANWQAWGTTMWPSVYLIDREGYLRSWWAGELNWQDNPGEQKFRKLIEAVLAE